MDMKSNEEEKVKRYRRAFVFLLVASIFIGGATRSIKEGEHFLTQGEVSLLVGINAIIAFLILLSLSLWIRQYWIAKSLKEGKIFFDKSENSDFEKKEKTKIFHYLKKHLLAVISFVLVIVILGGIFYWYELRPVEARKECHEFSHTLYRQKIISESEKEQTYTNCLRHEGLKSSQY